MNFDMNYSNIVKYLGKKPYIIVKNIDSVKRNKKKQIEPQTKMVLPKLPIIDKNVPIIEEENVLETSLSKTYKTKKLICLTFDDGPSKYTDELLNILYKNKCRATFFISGSDIVANKDIIKRIDTYGNQIGNSGYSHIPFTRLDVDEVNVEIAMTSTMLIDLGVNSSNIVRPPFGKLSESLQEEIHAPFILYDVDPEDWKHQDKNYIKQAIKDRVEDGSIVLLHDQYKETIDAVEELIPELKEEGYEFVTISEMQKRNGISFIPGHVYVKLRNVA